MKRLNLLLLAIALSWSGRSAAQTIAFEDFNDGNGASRWSVVSTEEVNTFTIDEQGNTTTVVAPPDYRVTFDFDYSILNLIPGFSNYIPEAPSNASGDSTTVAAYFQSNLVNYMPDSFTETVFNQDTMMFEQVQSTIFEGAGVGAVLSNFVLPDEFTFTADMFYAELNQGGSTEWATIGVHHTGLDETPVPFVGNGDGLAWTTSTDTDTSFNLRAYEAPPGGPSSSSDADVYGRRYSDIPDGTIPGVPTGDAADPGIENQWVTFKVTRIGDTVKWYINDTLIDQAAATDFDGGSVLIGNADAFDSVAPAYEEVNANAFIGTPFQAQFEEFVAAIPDGLTITNGAIFDNIRITAIPEPSGITLIGMGLLLGIGVKRVRR